VVGLETGVEELRELMPKAITIPPHGQGVEGAWNFSHPTLVWAMMLEVFSLGSVLGKKIQDFSWDFNLLASVMKFANK
jgi:hypothetical protein